MIIFLKRVNNVHLCSVESWTVKELDEKIAWVMIRKYQECTANLQTISAFSLFHYIFHIQTVILKPKINTRLPRQSIWGKYSSFLFWIFVATKMASQKLSLIIYFSTKVFSCITAKRAGFQDLMMS